MADPGAEARVEGLARGAQADRRLGRHRRRHLPTPPPRHARERRSRSSSTSLACRAATSPGPDLGWLAQQRRSARPAKCSVGSLLDPSHDRFGPRAVGTHLRGCALDVVVGPAKQDLAALVERPGGARVAVEWHADAAWIYEQSVVRAGESELPM